MGSKTIKTALVVGAIAVGFAAIPAIGPAAFATKIGTSIGLSGEVGDFNDIVKKCFFQGKEIDEDVVNHLKSELGDVMWYIAQACIALDITMDDVIETNIEKLESRYPGGFDAYLSNNRKEGDI